MSQLAAALDLARRGFRVFRLRPNDKRPARRDWQNEATSDPAQIFSLFGGGEFNVGVHTAGLCVVDFDLYKPNGPTTFRQWQDAMPSTLIVETGGGGLHYYFADPDNHGNTVGRLGPDCETRGAGGYVVAPGSVVDGRGYAVRADAPLATLPPAIAARITQRPGDTLTAEEMDTPAAVALATDLVANRAPAIEGCGGDDWTFRTVAAVRDCGVSEATAFDLLADWNERCEPPWTIYELREKISNGYRYAQNAPGSKSPVAEFDILPEPPQPQRKPEDWPEFREIDPTQPMENLARRPWIINRAILRGAVTTLVAPGGVGKSSLTLAWGMALAMGRGDWIGADVRERCRVLIVNNEDDCDEEDRRLFALCIEHDIDRRELAGRFFTYRDTFNALEKGEKAQLQRSAAFERLNAFIQAKNIDVVIMDPFASVAGSAVDENDNSQVGIACAAFVKLAKQRNLGVVLVHHTRKPGNASSESYAGDAHSARGASAMINASRVALTLYTMPAKDAEALGVDDCDRRSYVRLDQAKANYAAPGLHTVWLQHRSVILPNGETTGALRPHQFDDVGEKKREIEAESLAAIVREHGGKCRLAIVVQEMAKRPLWSGEKETTLRRKLEQVASRDGSGLEIKIEDCLRYVLTK